MSKHIITSESLEPSEETGPKVEEVTTAIFFGFEDPNGRQQGLVESLEQILAKCDQNADLIIDARDSVSPTAPPEVRWLKLDIMATIEGMREKFGQLVSSYDHNGNGILSEQEFTQMIEGINRITQRYPQFGDGLYMLTEARLMPDNKERVVTTERLLDCFDEMIAHGLPANSPSKQNER